MTTSAFNGAVPTASLPANASLLDLQISTPDVGTMRLVWALWVALAIPTILMASLMIAASMRRKSGLNLFIAAMALPDLVGDVLLAITCLLAYSEGRYPGALLCHLQCFYLSMMIFVSSWVNLFVGAEVYKILISTRALGQYKPPSRRTVWLVCCAVYAFCSLCAALQSVEATPVSPQALRGLVCFPASTNGLIFPLFITIGPGVLVPSALTAGLMFSAWRQGLVDWDLIFPRKGAVAPNGATRPTLKGALGDEAYQRGRAQARSVTLFFLRVMGTLAVWLAAAMLALFSQAVVLVFITVVLGSSLTLTAARPHSALATHDFVTSCISSRPCLTAPPHSSNFHRRSWIIANRRLRLKPGSKHARISACNCWRPTCDSPRHLPLLCRLHSNFSSDARLPIQGGHPHGDVRANNFLVAPVPIWVGKD
jgi:hypothetical protein